MSAPNSNIQNYEIPTPDEGDSKYSTSYFERVCEQVRSEILQYNIDPEGEPKCIDEFDVNPLTGYCYECACELSFTLFKAEIPHRIVKGGIRPLIEQYDELTEPYTMEDIEAVGARHWWIEVDEPNSDTTWILELCSENYNNGYCDIYVDTNPHDCLIRLDSHTNREPWSNDDPSWWWNTQTLESTDS